MTMLNFLNGWTVELDKLPTYDKFSRPFTVTFDKKISNLLISGINPKITKTMITNFKRNVLPYIDENDKLVVKHHNCYGLGRFYSDNDRSPICHTKYIKHTVYSYQNWLDVDMVKGHPSILLHIAKKNDVNFSAFHDVVYKFDEKWKDIADYYKKKCNVDLDEDNVKYFFNLTIYGGGYKKWLTKLADKEDADKYGYAVKVIPENIAIHPFMERFKNECRKLSQIIYENNPNITNKVAQPEDEEWERKGKTISYFCQIVENHIVYFAYNYLVKSGGILPNQCLPELDGICLPRLDGVDYQKLVDDINTALSSVEIRFKIKPYGKFVLNDIIEQRQEIDEETDDEGVGITDMASNADFDDELTDFEKKAKEFEKTHVKILNKQMFLKVTDEDLIFMTEAGLKVAYGHLSYEETVKKGKNEIVKNSSFIKKWISHENPKIRIADDVGVYPNATRCPKNIYNLWQPFSAVTFTGNCDKEGVGFILHHILLMCNNNTEVFNYIVKWGAHLLKHPEHKATLPTFVGQEGDGKSTIVRIFSRIIGSKRVFETSKPSRDIWGSFNPLMGNAYLVNLNELSKKDVMDAEGYIKALVTEPTLTINDKGKTPYVINSYHRFIVTTNKEDTIITENGDRRKIVIRTSSEKKGDVKYFNKLYGFIDDDTVIRNLYDYFMGVEVPSKFFDIPIPETEFQKNLKEKNRPIPEQWLEDFARRNDGDKELLGSEIYKDFTSWAGLHGIDYKTNSLKLGMYLSNCNINGVSKPTHTERGKMRNIDCDILKKHFGMGCLIKNIEEIEE